MKIKTQKYHITVWRSWIIKIATNTLACQRALNHKFMSMYSIVEREPAPASHR